MDAIGAFVDRALDLFVTQRLFSGHPGNGGQIVQSIAVTASPATAWVQVSDGPYAGSQVRRYTHAATISFVNGDVASIQTDQEFHVVPVDAGGSTEYRLLVWRELGPVAAKAEDLTWGRVKFGTGGVAVRAVSVGQVKAAHAP